MYLLIQLQKVIIRFKKPMNSISEQTHRKKVTTILSTSSTHSRGRRCTASEGCESCAEYPLVSKCSLLATSWGHFSKTTFTSPWELGSLLNKTGTKGTAALRSVLEERGVKKHTYKTSRLYAFFVSIL